MNIDPYQLWLRSDLGHPHKLPSFEYHMGTESWGLANTWQPLDMDSLAALHAL
jgi:hypothetical protein